MTNPGYYRNKEKNAEPNPEGRSWLKGAAVLIAAGGAVAAAAAFFIQKKELALGLFLGSLLSILYFDSFHDLSGKIMRLGGRARKVFWFWTLLRWAVAAFVCWGLVLISPSCLLGALGGYLWALAVLGWSGWRNAALAGTSPPPLRKD